MENCKQQITIWWADLMCGAVSVALVYNQFSRSGHTHLLGNAVMITSTITVVLCSTVVCSTVVFGLMTKPIVRIFLPSSKHISALSSEPSTPKSLTTPLLSDGQEDTETNAGSNNISRPKQSEDASKHPISHRPPLMEEIRRQLHETGLRRPGFCTLCSRFSN